MSARVYLLLDVVGGSGEKVASTLRRMPGVVLADSLEGRPDVLALLEAPGRMKLAELLMSVLARVDSVVEDLRMLVARDTAALFPSGPKLDGLRPIKMG